MVFLALSTGDKPAREIYDLAQTLHHRFNADVRALLMDLGFRATVSLRTGLHVGKVWQMPLGDVATGEPGAAHSVNISDAIVVASRIITAQTCRRFGMGLSRSCYKRLMLSGHKAIREPDEVIQDRNQYPEPVEVYRLRPEELEKLNQS